MRFCAISSMLAFVPSTENTSFQSQVGAVVPLQRKVFKLLRLQKAPAPMVCSEAGSTMLTTDEQPTKA